MKKADKTPSPRRLMGMLDGLQLLLVQCSVCALVLLIVWFCKWSHLQVFDSMASLFREAMLDDTLISAVTSGFQAETVVAQSVTSTRVLDVCAPLQNGTITSLFGVRDGVMHEGVDLAAEDGTPISAMMSGTVTTVSYDPQGYGHYAVIAVSDNEKYLYAHCKEVYVSEGDNVMIGQHVALVGNTGRSTGSHLHVEWIVDGEEVDPLMILPREIYA